MQGTKERDKSAPRADFVLENVKKTLSIRGEKEMG